MTNLMGRSTESRHLSALDGENPAEMDAAVQPTATNDGSNTGCETVAGPLDSTKSDKGIVLVDGLQRFSIPDEGEEELLDEEELNIQGDMAPRIRKPSRNEFFKVNLSSVFTTHILCYKPNPEAMEETLLYVEKGLRGKIAPDLRIAKFYLCFSCSSKRFFIWTIKVSEIDWYDSLETLLKKPLEFFESNEIRIKSDKELGRYRTFHRPNTEIPVWPARPMNELVTEAIGQANLIFHPNHPIYQEIISGEEVK